MNLVDFMVSKRLTLSLILIAAISSITVYFFYVNYIGPVYGTVRELVSNPDRYNGREVRIEGFLRKTWFTNRLYHNLSDAGAGIPISGNMDLDAYVGLRIYVEGRFRHQAQASDAPKMLIEVTSLSVREGSPHFFLQFERVGGITGSHDIYIIDNNSTAFFLSRGRQYLQQGLSQNQLQKASQIILNNSFLSLKGNIFEARDNAADYFTYSLKVILSSGSKLESKSVVWVDEWASVEPLPSNLTKVQWDLKNYFVSLLPPPSGGTLLEASADRSRIAVGEYILVRLKITNMDSKNHTYDISPPAFDMLLFYENGTLFSRWSEGQAFPTVKLSKTLEPDKSYEVRFFWNLYRYNEATLSHRPPSPGIYYLEGIFLSIPDLKAGKLRIEISRRSP